MNKPESGHTAPPWTTEHASRATSPLNADASFDVCVVGAGIAGLTTAYLLAREGKSVVLLDDQPIGGGETGRTTAHLSNAIDARYVEIERLHGLPGAQLVAASHTQAILRIETIAREESIPCEFRRLDGYLFAPANAPSDIIDRELEAAHRAGLTDVERLSHAPALAVETGPCLRFPGQAQFHPLLYLQGLARAFHRHGGIIHIGTHVKAVEDGPIARVTTTGGAVVHAGAVVVATNSPINDRVVLQTKLSSYRTYAIALEMPRGTSTEALYWDTLDPYHYVRSRPGDAEVNRPDLLIVGGEDHKTGQADDQSARFDRLESWARARFPASGALVNRWSGQVIETIDGLAYIGRNPGDRKVLIVTGDCGMGMTHGTIAGMLLTDLIVGRENPWAAVYDPARKSLKSAGEYVRENLNVAWQYGDWLTGGDVDDANEIAPGSGAVLRRGLSKVAAYRDIDGTLLECSAVCPHLGCLVNWNDAEKSWDCPCHGSRFNPQGAVLNGPAHRGLAPAGEHMITS